MPSQNNSTKPLRGIYLLPNLFTTAGIFSGFYAIVASMQAEFEWATYAIFVAMIMDSLDGRVARLTNTQTAFGVEYDSLADMVSFGVAPALVIYSWGLHNLGKFGWIVAFIYTATGALRLARFNTQVATVDKKYFQGLPIPAGAGIIASIVLLGHDRVIDSMGMSILIASISVVVGLLMVSNIRYYSFKEVNVKNKVPFVSILLVVIIFAFIAINPPGMLFLSFTSYGLSGIALTLWMLHKKRRDRQKI
jgi:CDP-diacylglycerol--serine O-phosphatidyltransferase